CGLGEVGVEGLAVARGWLAATVAAGVGAAPPQAVRNKRLARRPPTSDRRRRIASVRGSAVAGLVMARGVYAPWRDWTGAAHREPGTGSTVGSPARNRRMFAAERVATPSMLRR